MPRGVFVLMFPKCSATVSRQLLLVSTSVYVCVVDA